MAIFNSSGTVSGTSSASSAAGVVTRVSAGIGGSGDLTAAIGVVRVASSRFSGTSTLEWDYVQDASATISGTSPMTASALVAVTGIGVFQGGSSFRYSVPLVIAGSSFMSMATQVDTHLPPIRAITMAGKTFSWLQLLQRGDLSVFICDALGPVIPFAIKYRLIQVRLNGSRQAVGPRERTPVPGVAGEFYATGRAGEHGQPGQWIVEWTFQRASQSEVQVVELPYMVLDAVLSGDPLDVTCRKVKFGWN
jgi:hypothetical protein